VAAQRLVFSSPGLSSTPAEVKRLTNWWDQYLAASVGIGITADLGSPFVTRVDYLRMGPFHIGRSAGPVSHWERRREHLARDDLDHFTLSFNLGDLDNYQKCGTAERRIPSGAAALFDHTVAAAQICPGGGRVLGFAIPRRQLSAAVPHAEDLTGAVVPAKNEALRLLRNYAGMLFDEPVSSEVLLARAGQHLFDLAVLALGANRDAAEIAQTRGLRAVRLAAVLKCIRRDYADPGISPEGVARQVGISTRYLHDLLHESGQSFSERVQDLRLARAFALLGRYDGFRSKITDIAYDVGFSDLSYFNRAFRRKYGMTPTAARGGAAA
jgi:AraC-like DNA-binding protein